LCGQAERAGLEVFSSRRPGDKSAIVSLLIPGADLSSIVPEFKSQGVVINKRAGRIRVSPHCYNTTAEIDRLIELLRSLSF
jgi:selenocysteine lyase/cysteine desulfurase